LEDAAVKREPRPVALYYLVKVVVYEGEDIIAKNRENFAFIRSVMEKQFGANTELHDVGVRINEEDTLTLTVRARYDN
jgi:hypothetical protein